MNTTMFDFSSMQIPDNIGYNLPALDPISTPLYPMPLDDIDMMDIYAFHPHPTNMQAMDSTLAPVTDIFGFTRVCDPMTIDIMSGLPSDAFPKTSVQVMHEQNHAKLEESSHLEHERDIAIDKYHDAMRRGDYDEALKWERMVNDRQSSLYDLWDTPRYTESSVRAPWL